MESFLAEYHIDFRTFQDLLRTTPSLIAGSAPLALYLKSHGVEPGYTPGDMDIWIEEYSGRCRTDTIFLNFLFSQGYYLQKIFTKEENNNGQYDIQNHHIRGVVSLVDNDQRKIQLITIGGRGLVDYIKNAFDLSICVSWWNATDNQFETLYPELTLQKKMHISNKKLQKEFDVAERTNKLDNRIQKYTARGFQLEEEPCHSFEKADDRLLLSDSSLAEITAFDLFAYEDVSLCAFLKASPWHIVIKAGDTFQAFHRKQIYNYMCGRETHIPFLEFIYDTPNNQSILQSALDMFLYADYSIYELCSSYPISISPSRQKSIFTLKCYTIAQWLAGEVGLTLSPPALPADIPAAVPADAPPPLVPADVPADVPVDNNIPVPEIIINSISLSDAELIEYALNAIDNIEHYFHIQP